MATENLRTEHRQSAHDRLPSAGTRPQVAGALGRAPRLRGRRRSVAAQVLLPGDVRLSVWACARRPRSQLHHRRRDGAHQADAGLQRPAPVRVGRLRPAGRERRDQERDPSRGVHPRQHRPHEGPAPAAGHQLRVGTRAGDLRRRVLQVEPVALHSDVREGPGLPAEVVGQLVPGRPDGTGQRAGGGRRLLAVRHAGRDARSRAVVLPHHRLCRRAARQRPTA